jgi:hypothetical protein
MSLEGQFISDITHPLRLYRTARISQRPFRQYHEIFFDIQQQQQQQQQQLRGPYSASELYRLNDRHLSTKFNANFCG